MGEQGESFGILQVDLPLDSFEDELVIDVGQLMQKTLLVLCDVGLI